MTLHLIQSGLLALLFFAGLAALLSALLYPKVQKCSDSVTLPNQI